MNKYVSAVFFILALGGLSLYQIAVEAKFEKYGTPAIAIVKAKHEEHPWLSKWRSYYLSLNYAVDGIPYTQDYKTDLIYWNSVHPNDKLEIYYMQDNPSSVLVKEEHSGNQSLMLFGASVAAFIFWMFIL